ncbi:glycosyltransferase [Duganella sp. FT92W]|uniref:Glycosyltransferase n=1 Tax=Pseudoduganella rivuli TaxID=2666085 RepID=A0A7X2IJC7_9BURK|nr:glycosyltransferase [Pseudoduganella rivuli]MRV71106.1 glycosyltransferase [Pseudoduganella rivuli]
MRIVIDLQGCQLDAAPASSPALALVKALAARCVQEGHTTIAALHGSHTDSIDTLRAELAQVLPPARILTYTAPRGATGNWQRHTAREVRKGFFASLGADVVVQALRLDGAYADAELDTIPGVLNAAWLYSGARTLRHAQQLQAVLASAQLVLAGDDAVQAPLKALGANAVAAAPDDTGAAALLAALADIPAPAPAASAARPRLAYISPLPPEHSGIADYSAEVLAEIEQHYQIELIATPGATPDAALQRFPIRSAAWFDDHAAEFDRIVYHFGNSNMHKHMFGLLKRHPGVVVLHDFYLSGVLDNMERDGDQANAFMDALYASHGHSGLHYHSQHGRNPSIWEFPCNKDVLDHAAGVIVHSEFSKRLAEKWYGPGAADGWRTLPLLRGQGADNDPVQARRAARQALGIADDEYIVSTFGMLGSIKLNDRLLEAFLASRLAQDRKCRLVFVGANDPGPYGLALQQRIADSGLGQRIRITGFASATDYAHWLAASDTSVQLRTKTRGESSASALDCLLHGVPTIINAHGASADLPDHVLVKLADEFTTSDMVQALETLHGDSARRAQLSQAARAFVRAEHSPAHVGRLYVEAIEHFAQHSQAASYGRMVTALARPDAPRPPSQAALLDLAAAIAHNRAQAGQGRRQLLVDISALVQADFKTGIQRVVRSIVLALLKNPPPGYRVEPVYSQGLMRPYRYARRFTSSMLGGQFAPQAAEYGKTLEDAPVDTGAGDMFLGLDLAANSNMQNEALLLDMRRRGVAIWFVVYDLLPLLRPDCFTYGTDKHYGDYIKSMTTVVDGIASISRAVSDEVAEWLATHPNRRVTPVQLGYFHLGADIDASAPSTGLPPNAERVMQAVQSAPTLLMVGTLEPRKGQGQALAAFELLWQQGVDVNLVIVGKNGWMVEQLVKRLENHPQRENKLFWLPGVSDEMLVKLYGSCAALLAPSEGEGFGLPLIEAAQKKLPIIARGIPVFREVAGEHAYYFDGKEPQDLAGAIVQWLELHRAGKAPPSSAMPWLTWEQSAQQLMDVTVHGNHHGKFEAGEVAPQLLVDVSAVARDDLKTGIQRVVRAQLSELLRTPTTAYHVFPVYLTDEGGHWHYRYARRYIHQMLGTDSHGVIDEEVKVAAGDVFYSPDFFPRAVIEAARNGLYERWRSQGVRVHFLIHDILPVLRPEFFPPRTDSEFGQWLSAVSANADRLICISDAVADETRNWLQQAAPQATVPPMAVVHHGADIAASTPSKGLPDDAGAVLADLASAPSFLMVGTIEPRKGHLQALDAFEQLWAGGSDVRLVIVGGEGWKGLPDGQRRTIPSIIGRLSNHPELGKRLHWLRGISDEYLDQVYGASACLLVPSEGEGFGLPLIEAARHGLPLIARDIPVFREVARDHALYFSGKDGAQLAAAVQEWLQLNEAGQVAASTGMPWQTWAQNVAVLTETLFPKAA